MLNEIKTVFSRQGHVCPWWMVYTFDNGLRRFVTDPDRVLGDRVRPGMTVLDLGCGRGFFSLELAARVGEQGRVISVDLQEEMLAMLRSRAERAGLGERIRTHRCSADRIGVEGPVDFALAFWMVHELPDRPAFFREVRDLLEPDGRLLVVEPRGHVWAGAFRRTVQDAVGAGLAPCEGEEPRLLTSRAALFRAAPGGARTGP